jgi:hypothetical protein
LTGFCGDGRREARRRAKPHWQGAWLLSARAFVVVEGFQVDDLANACPRGDIALEKVRDMAGA